MKLTCTDTTVEVTLSRRNLLALLAKLDQPWSERALELSCADGNLRVRSEEDSEHYDRLPGPMHPSSQRLADRIQDAISRPHRVVIDLSKAGYLS